MQHLDVLIVGAGPAGIGMALALQKIPDLKFGLVERGRIGESFRRWPLETRFITPSFYSNPFGLADLNAVNEHSSPAHFAAMEHLSGELYADYLNMLVQVHKLPVVTGCKVLEVNTTAAKEFVLETEQGPLSARYVIWATGEYQFPDLQAFTGADYCVHYAQVATWKDFTAPRYTVIGGYESGVDATVNLIKQGRQVRLLVRKASWDRQSDDPSVALSPYSRERLAQAMQSGQLEVIFGVDVTKVSQQDDGSFLIEAADDRNWQEQHQPILATGFVNGGGAQQIARLWEWDEAGKIMLTEADESTLTPGLFLVGPQVRQEDRIYCFIYKFRQRFAMIAQNLALCMALDSSQLDPEPGVWGPFGNSECCEGCEC
ncbi:NAD(P)/FAD-dependent oxidoreductase [Methylophaga muralis]|uniref:Glutathione reductase n=1 Tax=Methylophaga muralis TaxID=291169 RepID=A0A1E3GQ60_9GAMM|nr:NAD(P)/FAD-dependent oxidoreductase [Methylophaga muralis]ODN66157.1 glutathione reductase [Methylophaga muralis]